MSQAKEVADWLGKPWGPADFINRFTGSDLRPYHPFGHWFGIHRWPTEHGPIDQYEPHKYNRRPMTVEFLD